MKKRKLPKGLKEVARLGRTFGGLVIPIGVTEKTKTVAMYVTLTQCKSKFPGALMLGSECMTLRELKGQIDNLKKDLDWVYTGMKRIREKQEKA